MVTTGEFAAIRGAGFEPVGQAFGAAVYAAGSASASSCPGAWVSAGEPEPFGPLAQAMYQARRAAIDRMATECAQLGGHGVIGVRLSEGMLPFGGLQFTAIGTAVRAPGVASGQRAPFTCDVSGQDFAKLITAGWIPVGLAFGISIGSRHDDWTTVRQARWGMRNAEVAGWTELVNRSWHHARRRLEGEVRRLGADGVVLTEMRMRVRARDCPVTTGGRDHIAEATFAGTAIASFSLSHAGLPGAGEPGPGRGRAGPPLTVMSLDPRRGQAARVRI
jgi:uncharacterized protein YbjQ (UPF0145 family)